MGLLTFACGHTTPFAGDVTPSLCFIKCEACTPKDTLQLIPRMTLAELDQELSK